MEGRKPTHVVRGSVRGVDVSKFPDGMLEAMSSKWRHNGFESVRGPGHMTKEEVRTMLKALFNITDEMSIDVVYEEMEEQRKKKEEGEC